MNPLYNQAIALQGTRPCPMRRHWRLNRRSEADRASYPNPLTKGKPLAQNSSQLEQFKATSADELLERRRSERLLRLIELHESFAIQAESASTPTLRRGYAERYRRAIGVFPERRVELAEALRQRINATIAEILESIDSESFHDANGSALAGGGPAPSEIR